MNQCRSEGENSRVLIPCSNGKYGVPGSKFSAFLKKNVRPVALRRLKVTASPVEDSPWRARTFILAEILLLRLGIATGWSVERIACRAVAWRRREVRAI